MEEEGDPPQGGGSLFLFWGGLAQEVSNLLSVSRNNGVFRRIVRVRRVRSKSMTNNVLP